MTSKVRVASLAELSETSGITVDLKGKKLALFKKGDAVYALDDACPHRGGPLSRGAIEKGEVACPWHNWRFRIADGTVAFPLSAAVSVACHAVHIENNEVYVEWNER